MSYNNLFSNPAHPRVNIHNDAVKANLGTKLNNVRDRQHTQQEIPIFDVNNSVSYQPVSTFGASLLDTTSLSDLRAQILENNSEEAIRLLADGNNEINFYTGGTGASNLRMQIKDSGISINTNMFPNADGTVDIGSNSLKFNEIYGNNIRAHTSLYASQIRPYSGSNVHFHSTSITTDNGNSLSVDRVQSTASNRDLFLGNGATDKIIIRNSTPIEIFDSVVIGSPSSGLIDLGTVGNPFGFVYTTTLSAASNVSTGSVTAADVEASVSIVTRGNNSYISVEDDTAANGKVQIISENSVNFTGYLSFIKNNIRQLFIGFNNSLQFENGSDFIIRSDQQKYLNFIHDATPANRKMEVSCDLLPEFDLFYDLGSASLKYGAIHAATLNSSIQVKSNQIQPYTGSSVSIDGDLLPTGDALKNLGSGSNRWLEIFCLNTTINNSDRNMKKDIEPIKNGLGLDIVRKLEPVSYKWKENSHGRIHTGYIAQDFLKASPWGDNWSAYVDTGHGLALRYGEITCINTAAIKEIDDKLNRVINSISGETKVDLSVHTPNEEIIERLEALENKKPLAPVVEECDHSYLEKEIEYLKSQNNKQNDIIQELVIDNQELNNKLNMLLERFEKSLEDKQNVELKIVDDSDVLLSENGNDDHMEQIESRLYTLESKITKITNKQAKLVTAVNKLKK